MLEISWLIVRRYKDIQLSYVIGMVVRYEDIQLPYVKDMGSEML